MALLFATRLVRTSAVARAQTANVSDNSVGSLHDHVINFKVDLDVVGTSNSLLYTHTDQEVVEQPWFDEDWGKTVIQQKITREFIENEDMAMLKFPHNFQGGYSLVNRDKPNRWDAPRGYAIHPGYSPITNVRPCTRAPSRES